MRIFSKFFLRSEANAKFFSLVRSEAKAKISQKLRKKAKIFRKLRKKAKFLNVYNFQPYTSPFCFAARSSRFYRAGDKAESHKLAFQLIFSGIYI